jgi:hypothetical protein
VCGGVVVRAKNARGRASVYCGAICRNRKRAAERAAKRPGPPPVERRHHPATCERDYDDAELEFLKAVDRYRREKRRPYPTSCELLRIAVALGYRKVAANEAAPA